MSGFNRVYKPIPTDTKAAQKDTANVPRIAESLKEAANECGATIGKIRTESVDGHNIVYTQTDRLIPTDKHRFDGWTYDYTEQHNAPFRPAKDS